MLELGSRIAVLCKISRLQKSEDGGEEERRSMEEREGGGERPVPRESDTLTFGVSPLDWMARTPKLR
jgi:hypothetical protein